MTKTLTCKQLGGPCDHQLRGNTADEVIKAQNNHLKETVAEGDEMHKEAREKMKGRWKNPVSGMSWYRKASVILRLFPRTSRALLAGWTDRRGTGAYRSAR